MQAKPRGAAGALSELLEIVLNILLYIFGVPNSNPKAQV